ncbi:MAG: hypothetical protein PHW18_02440 [Sulfuricurvum sp.]|uniref:hypothetical protein n=1 Tax=Sulfuricurvum sp. TaxID=2025608 RepID=UPI0026093282|nr:hypothetical protein [Sulfuricurvum sp.]MDD2828414.1 hypothetical protein [Sulfuricurvum sp.]MDD4949419.1 hypothetical protein [Sulfuricurvum sp.]
MPIKPLTAQTLSALLSRIDNARYGEVRSVSALSSSSIEVQLSAQDIARGYDWIDVAFRIDGVRDAKLVSDNVLEMLDMREGISVSIDNEGCALAIGGYSGREGEAPFYILGTSLGYEELPFSG